MPNEKIDDKIIRTFARIQTPLLENIKVDFGKNKVIEKLRVYHKFQIVRFLCLLTMI